MTEQITTITFGTSGFRGVMEKSFTLKDVKRVSHGIGQYLLTKNSNPQVIIGYDPRQGNDPNLSEGSFTHAIVNQLIESGIDVLFCESYTPTPVVSWYITRYGLDGGIILTASHNPPEYNGLKFNPANGAPAPVEITSQIQAFANQEPSDSSPSKSPGQLTRLSDLSEFSSDMFQLCESLVGPFDLSSSSVIVDAKYGTTAKIWTDIFDRFGIITSQIVNQEPRSDFGGIETNPTKLESLTLLKETQAQSGSQVAIANDPDGDRHTILDENGEMLTPEETCGIILDYLISNKAPIYGVATTLASSRLIKIIATLYGVHYEETSVGFKYFAPFFEKAKSEGLIGLAVESSGGFSLSDHIYEKCGFLPGLLLLIISQQMEAPLSHLKKALLKAYGKAYFLEEEFQFQASMKEVLVQTFKSATKESMTLSFEEVIDSVITQDGLKIIFHNQDWVLMRLSGTEPLARIYAESGSQSSAESLIRQASLFLDNI